MGAQIRQDQPVSCAELLGNRNPEVVVQRKRVQQDHIPAVASNFIEELSVGAAEDRHGLQQNAKGESPPLLMVNGDNHER